MFLPSLRLTAVAAVAALTAIPAAAQDTTTFLQFFQDTNARLVSINRVAGLTTFSVTNAPVNAIALDFIPGAPVLFDDVFFSFNASSNAPILTSGAAFSQSGFAGAISFTTGGGLNLLTLDFDNGLTSAFVGADSGSFSSDSAQANINLSSDYFDVTQWVRGNFSLSISGLSTPVALGDYSTTGNISGTFAAAVPEPATWGLMIAGFGMVGFAARRRRIKHTLA